MKHNPKDNQRAVEFAKAFSNFVNSGFRNDCEDAAKLCLRDHRTLQQGMMHFCIKYIEGMADYAADSYYDLRNEAAVLFADKVMKTTSDTDRIMPMI